MGRMRDDGRSTAAPRTCVIGAGSSGIAAAKALREAGIPFDCFEMSDRVGGNWVYDNPNGVSSCSRSLHINTSKARTQYSDFPMPEEWPDYPDHARMAEYFRRYAEHFDLLPHVSFNTKVERALREDDESWSVTLGSGETRSYDALVVANGHHWDPLWPEPAYSGHFDGEQIHSHHSLEPSQLEGKRVLVIGFGNSAVDIACDSAVVAERTLVSVRRGVYVFRKYLFGQPSDVLFYAPFMPRRLVKKMSAVMHHITIGPMENYGLPKPDHEVLDSHPTVSEEVLSKIGHGDIAPVGAIERLDGDAVVFSDGRREPVDVIVWCTGYRITFPFFDEGFFSAPGNITPPLYRHVFSVDYPNLMFVGLVQPFGAIMPMAERQSTWIVEYLRGAYRLPSRAAMLRQARNERADVERKYIPAPRQIPSATSNSTSSTLAPTMLGISGPPASLAAARG